MQAPVVYAAIKQPNLCDRTVEYLMELILSGELAPGDYLPAEPELCKNLNVSRATVREAVRILEARGLVERRHGVGILIVDRSRQAAAYSVGLMLQRHKSSIRDLFEVRLGLECQAAALAATRATDSDIQLMAQAIETMRRQSSTVEEYVEADLNFHLRLAESTHNSVLVALTDTVHDLLLETVRSTYVLDGRTARRLRDHSRVLEAIASHGPLGAEAAMRAHMRSTEAMLRRIGLLDLPDGVAVQRGVAGVSVAHPNEASGGAGA
ncbi:MAG: FadR family transcriptional regulator [Chloroflexota bacterium]|nr:MAG: FadR family transcriptional regulator [Chloroflexota bacterium]